MTEESLPDGYIDLAGDMDKTISRVSKEGWSPGQLADYEMSNQISNLWKNQKRLIKSQVKDDELRPTLARAKKVFSNVGIGVGIILGGLLTAAGGWIFVTAVQPDTSAQDEEMRLLRDALKRELGIDVKGPEQKK